MPKKKKKYNTYIEKKKHLLAVIFIITHIFKLTHNENENKNIFPSVRHNLLFSNTFYFIWKNARKIEVRYSIFLFQL